MAAPAGDDLGRRAARALARVAGCRRSSPEFAGRRGSCGESEFALEGSRERQRRGCGSKPMVQFWGRCTTHFCLFSGDWDVYWGYGILTHGHMVVEHEVGSLSVISESDALPQYQTGDWLEIGSTFGDVTAFPVNSPSVVWPTLASHCIREPSERVCPFA